MQCDDGHGAEGAITNMEPVRLRANAKLLAAEKTPSIPLL
jgi:hypothetical protein